MSEKCQVCGVEGDDRRTLVLSFFYEIKECSPKFDAVNVHIQEEAGNREGYRSSLYRIRTCKNCRGDFLDLLKKWANGECITKQEPTDEKSIPIREHGRVIYITKEEWDRRLNEVHNRRSNG